MFVSSTLESWKEFFSATKEIGQAPEPPGKSHENPNKPIAQSSKVNAPDQFGNVYDLADGKLKIICGVPGSNKAEKTRNTALIYLFGRVLDGVEAVPSDELRQACLDQGCYDQANFAQYLKSLKSRVVMNTKPGGAGYDVRLTAPGRKDARELVEKLNAID